MAVPRNKVESRVNGLPLTQGGTDYRLPACVAVLASLWLAACGKATREATGAPGTDGSAMTASGGIGGADTSGFGGTLSAGADGGARPTARAGSVGAATGGGESAPRLLLQAVASGNGRYVAAGRVYGALGSESILLTSESGESWNLSYRSGSGAFGSNPRVNETLASVAFGSGYWMAVGWKIEQVGTQFVHSSLVLGGDDASSWRALPVPEASDLVEVFWTGAEFLAHANPASGQTLWAFGINSTWKRRGVDPRVPSQLAMGAPGLVGCWTEPAFSDDAGETWTFTSLGDGRRVVGVWAEGNGFGGTAAERCCNSESTDEVYYSMRSDDGLSWKLETAPGVLPSAVARTQERWVGLSAFDSRIVHRDSNSSPWMVTSVTANAVTAGERFVAVGDGIWSSNDGAAWTPAAVPAFK